MGATGARTSPFCKRSSPRRGRRGWGARLPKTEDRGSRIADRGAIFNSEVVMKIGLFTDGLMHLPFEDALAAAARIGVQAVEIGTGNFSSAPHCDLPGLLAHASARNAFLGTI